MKLLNWEMLKLAVEAKYEVKVNDENLRVEGESFVKLHLEEEVLTVAVDVRNEDESESIGYELI